MTDTSTEAAAPTTTRQWRTVVLALLAAGSLAAGIAVAVAVAPAQAAPYVNCNRPVYNGKISATMRCDAASTAQVRFWVRCWSGPVPTATQYSAWVTIPAGTSKTLLYMAHGWCSGIGQQWTVDPQIAGA